MYIYKGKCNGGKLLAHFSVTNHNTNTLNETPKKLQHITKATPKNAKILAELAKASFIPAHGHAAPKKDIDSYMKSNFNEITFKKELENSKHHYYLIYYNNKLAGYSKVIFNIINKDITNANVTKMERLYLLKEFYGLDLAKHLVDFNCNLAKKNNQNGVWVYVWVENKRAISFYTKMGFKIVGSYDFKVSETHSNPNYVMYLEF